MFETGYEFSYKGSTWQKDDVTGEPFLVQRWSCKSNNKHRYMIQAETYQEEITAIKFYLKNHADSSKKYNLVTYFEGTSAQRIIRTAINVMLELLSKKPAVSFLIIGAPMEEEKQTPSKRFRIYEQVMRRFFSEVNFAHYKLEEKNCYVLLNRNNGRPDILNHIQTALN